MKPIPPLKEQLARYLMDHGVLKNADADTMALEIEEMFGKERDELRVALEKAYRAGCHFMACRDCADSYPCVTGKMHANNLVACEPLIGIGKETK